MIRRAVLDLTLADADLELVLARVAKMHVIDVLQHLVVAARPRAVRRYSGSGRA